MTITFYIYLSVHKYTYVCTGEVEQQTKIVLSHALLAREKINVRRVPYEEWKRAGNYFPFRTAAKAYPHPGNRYQYTE